MKLYPGLACLLLLAATGMHSQSKNLVHAKASFDVKMTSAETTGFEKANDITRFASDTGSMAYVAIERMTGKLNGRQGSFTFTHRATMMKGDDHSAGDLSVTVVPNSGSGELAGLTGSLMIHIDAQGRHTWTFDYSLP